VGEVGAGGAGSGTRASTAPTWDFPWILGMFRRSDIMMGRLSVESLLDLSHRTP
jgi:hypothetical protein